VHAALTRLSLLSARARRGQPPAAHSAFRAEEREPMDADYRSPHDGRPAQDPKETSTTADAAPEGPRRRGNRHHAFRGKNRVRKGPRTEQPATPTSAEMRAARPSGRTPGTSTAYEPAAAPLGTDDEAAGTPPRPQDLEREIQRAARGGGMQGLPADEAMS